MISTRPPLNLDAVALALRKRADKRLAVALFRMVLGGILSLYGPLVMAMLVWFTLLFSGYWVSWWLTFAAGVLVMIPLEFWTERRTHGNFLAEAVKGGGATTTGNLWLVDAVISTCGIHSTDALSAYATDADPAGIVELMLWGPRQVNEGFSLLRLRAFFPKVDVKAEAAILLKLLQRADAMAMREVTASAGQPEVVRMIAYLAYYDWVGVAADGSRVWALTDGRRDLLGRGDRAPRPICHCLRPQRQSPCDTEFPTIPPAHCSGHAQLAWRRGHGYAVSAAPAAALSAAHVAALAKPLVAPVLAGLAFVDATRIGTKRDAAATQEWLRAQKFDTAILLSNSFRSAWMVYRAGIPRRLGYARELRGWMLTDKLRPTKKSAQQRTADRAKRSAILTLSRGPLKSLPSIRGFEPVPTISYYLALADLLGGQGKACTPNGHMELGITDEDRAQAGAVLVSRNIPDARPLVIMVPGANFGSSKCWVPERFADVAVRLIDPAGPFDATVLIASSPAELPIVNAIMEHATAKARNAIPEDRLVALAALNNGQGVPLGALKELTRRARLMLCNDTGPRHFAAAFDVPTVTLFGPTDPRWAETFSKYERQVQIPVPCGPCQLKRCPIDHRCMTNITPEMVLAQITALWYSPPSPAPEHPSLITQDSP